MLSHSNLLLLDDNKLTGAIDMNKSTVQYE